MTRLILTTTTGVYCIYLAAFSWSPAMATVALGSWATSAAVIVRLEYRRAARPAAHGTVTDPLRRPCHTPDKPEPVGGPGTADGQHRAPGLDGSGFRGRGPDQPETGDHDRHRYGEDGEKSSFHVLPFASRIDRTSAVAEVSARCS